MTLNKTNTEGNELWYWEGKSLTGNIENGRIFGDYNEINKHLEENHICVKSIWISKKELPGSSPGGVNNYQTVNKNHYLIFNTLLIFSIILTLGLVLSSVDLFNISSKTVFLILINVFLWIKIGNLLKT